jgi:hypothetical protein
MPRQFRFQLWFRRRLDSQECRFAKAPIRRVVQAVGVATPECEFKSGCGQGEPSGAQASLDESAHRNALGVGLQELLAQPIVSANQRRPQAVQLLLEYGVDPRWIPVSAAPSAARARPRQKQLCKARRVGRTRGKQLSRLDIASVAGSCARSRTSEELRVA